MNELISTVFGVPVSIDHEEIWTSNHICIIADSKAAWCVVCHESRSTVEELSTVVCTSAILSTESMPQ